jgi:hypothetical protein
MQVTLGRRYLAKVRPTATWFGWDQRILDEEAMNRPTATLPDVGQFKHVGRSRWVFLTENWPHYVKRQPGSGWIGVSWIMDGQGLLIPVVGPPTTTFFDIPLMFGSGRSGMSMRVDVSATLFPISK